MMGASMNTDTLDRTAHETALSLPEILGIGMPRERTPQANGGTWPEGTRLVSVDSHWLENGDVWTSRFPEHLRDKAPRIWRDEAGAWRMEANGKELFSEAFTQACTSFEGIEGITNVKARLKDLDVEGMEKELLFPQRCLVLIREANLECRSWVFRAYNEYIASVCAEAPDRLYGVGMVNFWDPAGARESVEHIKALGLRAIMTPINPGRNPDGVEIQYAAPEMEPFWSAIEDSGLPVCFHIGEQLRDNDYGGIGGSFLAQTSGFRLNFGQLVFGGVFDRHPRLRIVFVEAGISWVASTLQDADMIYESYSQSRKVDLNYSPSWYWYNHCYASFMVDPVGLRLLDVIGADRVMWSTDYPHNESTLGYTRSAAQAVFEATNVADAQKIVGLTAIEVFNMR
jgi:predicted TIM-barrel fold metal-dependent hydrolase